MDKYYRNQAMNLIMFVVVLLALFKGCQHYDIVGKVTGSAYMESSDK